MTSPAVLVDRIAALTDEQAVFVLQAVMERQGVSVDPFQLTEQQTHLQEALAQPEINNVVSPQIGATPGDLARTALTHLAEDDATAQLIERAMALRPTGERDLGLLLVGSLVLFAFRADITLARDPDKGWSFRFRTKPMSDSVIGKALSQLLGVYTK